MKNNILAIIVAAGTAVVGSSLFSAPAHALEVEQNVDVEIKVPEVLYLRTFDKVSLDITGDDLAGTEGVFVNGPGTSVGKDKGGITTGATPIDKNTPFIGVSSVTKTVDELFAVWSNNPDGGVNVTLTPATSTLTGPNSATATIASVTKLGTDPTTAPGLVNPYYGGADIEFNLSNASAVGTYTGGVINVKAVAP